MRWGVVAVALLAVSAGCGAFPVGGSERQDTVTPVPVPGADESVTDRTPSTRQFPPGVTRAGIVDIEALTAAHEVAVRDRSYVWRERFRRVSHATGSNSQTHREATVWVADRTHYRRDEQVRKTSYGKVQVATNESRYRNGSVAFRRVHRPTGTRINPFSGYNVPTDAAERSAFLVRQYMAVEETEVIPVERDGRRFLRVLARNSSVTWSAVITNYSLRAVVTPQGFVRELDVTYEIHNGGLFRAASYRFWYDAVGNATVPDPDWLSTARGNATANGSNASA